MKFTKKPVAIEAVQWDGKNHRKMFEFLGGGQGDPLTNNGDHFHIDHAKGEGGLVIKTLEGEHFATIGDFIIRGVKGEYYPCKPDIFEMTYDQGPKNTGPKPSDKYKHCNHHHEIDDKHEVVNLGGEEFVANKDAIPLLKALNEIGLHTRSHHIEKGKASFFSLLLDDVGMGVQTVHERDTTRTKYNGKKELIITFGAK